MSTPEIILENLGYDRYGNNPELLAESDKKKIEAGAVDRAGMMARCDACGFYFYQHPRVQGAVYLTRVCGNRLVKL